MGLGLGLPLPLYGLHLQQGSPGEYFYLQSCEKKGPTGVVLVQEQGYPWRPWERSVKSGRKLLYSQWKKMGRIAQWGVGPVEVGGGGVPTIHLIG